MHVLCIFKFPSPLSDTYALLNVVSWVSDNASSSDIAHSGYLSNCIVNISSVLRKMPSLYRTDVNE